jgi:hypothetical protein
MSPDRNDRGTRPQIGNLCRFGNVGRPRFAKAAGKVR